MAKKKYEIDINIGGRKELKETIKDIETLDKNIMASKFSSKLAKMLGVHPILLKVSVLFTSTTTNGAFLFTHR